MNSQSNRPQTVHRGYVKSLSFLFGQEPQYVGVSLSPCLSSPTFVAIRKVMDCVCRSSVSELWRTSKVAAGCSSGTRIMCFENFYKIVEIRKNKSSPSESKTTERLDKIYLMCYNVIVAFTATSCTKIAFSRSFRSLPTSLRFKGCGSLVVICAPVGVLFYFSFIIIPHFYHFVNP